MQIFTVAGYIQPVILFARPQAIKYYGNSIISTHSMRVLLRIDKLLKEAG